MSDSAASIASRMRRGRSLHLPRYFAAFAQSWLNLQTIYDLRMAEVAVGKRIAHEVLAMERVAR
ncbi:hypothetical protein [Pseudolysobacter antarcticus]|uniref:hypothetical protein n=1 Tax=Pseudolysobacter antarcticus TaxID=2511995 RepID=UPI0013EA2330|nr:hypothetical protein [Pseudolysobacter antarcticus]